MDKATKSVEEFERMFVEHLARRDKSSAAHVLVQQVEFLRNRDFGEACATAKKIVELFGTSRDENVMEAVVEACEFLFEPLPADDPDFIKVCRIWGRILHRRGDAHSAATTIAELEEALDGIDNSVAAALLEDFLEARLSQLRLDDEVMLRARLAANYLYIRRFQDAISTCTWLLVNDESDSTWDYILWCGEAYLRLGRKDLAIMHFREVQRGLGDSDDERALKASHHLDLLMNGSV